MELIRKMIYKQDATNFCCRICHENLTSDEKITAPCKCKGSMKYVHVSCLINWVRYNGRRNLCCEICGDHYELIKIADIKEQIINQDDDRVGAADRKINRLLRKALVGLIIVCLVTYLNYLLFANLKSVDKLDDWLGQYRRWFSAKQLLLFGESNIIFQSFYVELTLIGIGFGFLIRFCLHRNGNFNVRSELTVYAFRRAYLLGRYRIVIEYLLSLLPKINSIIIDDPRLLLIVQYSRDGDGIIMTVSDYYYILFEF